MKKIGILTFHRALNYGAVLQTYALVNIIKQISNNQVEVEAIDYRCDAIEATRSISKRFNKITIKNFPNLLLLLYKKWFYNRFIRTTFDISKNKYNHTNIDSSNAIYDCFIVGSDQVWNYNLNGYDNTYLLDFVTTNTKKNSYAASLGLNEIESTQFGYYTQLLQEFKYLSVREKESENYFKKIIGNINIKTSLDPTLLLTQEQWNALASSRKRKGYILVYNVPKPDHLFELAKQLEEKTNVKSLYITNNQRPFVNISQLVFPSIETFLALFRDADYVLTNSFHGTVFSILFHRPFLVEKKQGSLSNDRIDTLLLSLGLSDRVSNFSDVNLIFSEINWQNTDSLLEKLRNSSINYLTQICDEVKENK